MYLANLCVEPESRNRGLGTALLHEAQDEAWRIGRLTAVSGTVDANDSSLQRYVPSYSILRLDIPWALGSWIPLQVL